MPSWPALRRTMRIAKKAPRTHFSPSLVRTLSGNGAVGTGCVAMG